MESVSEQVAGVLGKAPATLPELLVSPGKADITVITWNLQS